jgi:hypothetical protein
MTWKGTIKIIWRLGSRVGLFDYGSKPFDSVTTGISKSAE